MKNRCKNRCKIGATRFLSCTNWNAEKANKIKGLSIGAIGAIALVQL